MSYKYFCLKIVSVIVDPLAAHIEKNQAILRALEANDVEALQIQMNAGEVASATLAALQPLLGALTTHDTFRLLRLLNKYHDNAKASNGHRQNHEVESARLAMSDLQFKTLPEADRAIILWLIRATGILGYVLDEKKSAFLYKRIHTEVPTDIHISKDDLFRLHILFDIVELISSPDYGHGLPEKITRRIQLFDSLLKNDYSAMATKSAVAAETVYRRIAATQQQLTPEFPHPWFAPNGGLREGYGVGSYVLLTDLQPWGELKTLHSVRDTLEGLLPADLFYVMPKDRLHMSAVVAHRIQTANLDAARAEREQDYQCIRSLREVVSPIGPSRIHLAGIVWTQSGVLLVQGYPLDDRMAMWRSKFQERNPGAGPQNNIFHITLGILKKPLRPDDEETLRDFTQRHEFTDFGVMDANVIRCFEEEHALADRLIEIERIELG